MAASPYSEARDPHTPMRSKWSPWLWLLVIVSTFLSADLTAGTGAAWACSAAMVISAMLQHAVGSPFRIHRVTIRSFWFLTYLAMIFFPGFFTYSGQLDPFRSSFLIAVVSVVVTVPLGFLLASWLSNFRETETEAFFQNPLENHGSRQVPLKFLVLLGISLILIVIYLRDVETVPLFYLMRHPGDGWVLALLREDAFKLLNSPLMYLFYLLRGTAFPFLIAASFGYVLLTRRKNWRAAFLAALIIGIFFNSLSLAKSPVAVIFLVLALLAYYYKRGVFSYKFVLVCSVIIFAFPLVVMYAATENDGTFGVLMQSLFQRLFLQPSTDVYYYFEFFPAQRAYLHGGSTHALASLFGMSVVNTPNLVGQYADPYGLQSISANGAFITDLHADFGLAGVLIGGVLAGVVMQLFHIYLVRRKKTVATLAAYAFLVYAFWQLNSTSLPPVLASGGALPVLGLLWFIDGRPWPNWFSRKVPARLATGEAS